MKDAELVALAEAQWIRSYVRLLMGSRSMPIVAFACWPISRHLQSDCLLGWLA